MRLTVGKADDAQFIDDLLANYPSAWGFTSDTLTDMLRILVDRDSFRASGEVFQTVLDSYLLYDIGDIQKALHDVSEVETILQGLTEMSSKEHSLAEAKQALKSLLEVAENLANKGATADQSSKGSGTDRKTPQQLESGKKGQSQPKDKKSKTSKSQGNPSNKGAPQEEQLNNVQRLKDMKALCKFLKHPATNLHFAGGGAGKGDSRISALTRLTTLSIPKLQAISLSSELEEVQDLSREGVFKEAPIPEERIDISPMKASQDLLRVLPSQFALEEDTFYVKAAKHELLSRQFISRVDTKQVIHLLVDKSESMEDNFKITFTLAVCLAQLGRVKSHGDRATLTFFDRCLGAVHHIDTPERAEEYMRNLIGGGMYTPSGGTSLLSSLRQLLKHEGIVSPENVDKKRILLITDGEDSALPEQLVEIRKRVEEDSIEVHSVFLYDDTVKPLPVSVQHLTRVELLKGFSDTVRQVTASSMRQDAFSLTQIFDIKETGVL